MGQRVIHVANQLVDEFVGWLEFAGKAIPGVASCPEWPPTWTIREVKIDDERCGCTNITGTRSFVIKSPWFPENENRCWEPTFYSDGRVAGWGGYGA